MSISFFDPPPVPRDEEARNDAVRASGIIDRRGDRVLREIVEELSTGFASLLALISAILDETQHIVAATGMPLGAYSRRNSFCGHAIAAGSDIFCVPDLTQDHRFADNPWVNGEHGAFRFYAAAQLVHDRQPIGGLCVVGTNAREPLTATETTLLRTASAKAMQRIAAVRGGIG